MTAEGRTPAMTLRTNADEAWYREMGVIADPPTLPDFANLSGHQVTAIGDDGDIFLALGHHDPRTIARVFNRFAVSAGVQGRNWWREHFESFTDMAATVETRWAEFTGTPNDWYADWSATEPAPGLVAVTVLDCS